MVAGRHEDHERTHTEARRAARGMSLGRSLVLAIIATGGLAERAIFPAYFRSYTPERHIDLSPSRGWAFAPSITSAIIVAGVTLPNRASGKDHIVRHHKRRPWPTRVFSFLRLCDPISCAALLRRRAMTPRDCVFLGMSAIGALRHWLWASKINLNNWTWELAVSVAVFNWWFDWTHAQNLLRRQSLRLGGAAYAGIACFVAGSCIESVAELQRRKFKEAADNPAFKKAFKKAAGGGLYTSTGLYTGGLFRYATNVNYLGYILWRTGIGLVTAPPYTLACVARGFRIRAHAKLSRMQQRVHVMIHAHVPLSSSRVLI